MAEELGEKSELPTTRKRGEARGRGQVARSQDLGSAIDLIGATILIALFGSFIAGGMRVLIIRGLGNDSPQDLVTIDSIRPLVMFGALQAAKVLLPIMLLMFVIAYLAQALQVGLMFSTQPLQPKIDRLNPIAGVKRLFSKRSLMKTVVSIIKLTAVLIIVTLVIRRQMPKVVALPMLQLVQVTPVIAWMMAELVAWLLVLLLVIGLIDFFYQRWQHTQDLKMTKQEVKDERRSMEGDPETKSRRARMAQEVAMQRIQQNVPDADVIVTNPTHFSVAIKYDADGMAAPRVTAKGADILAMRIRHVALMSSVPIVERPPLARALYWNVDVGGEISPEHYEAVAEVLAYVYRLEGSAA
jgi:flagellar biosynthesis protein FlhB